MISEKVFYKPMEYFCAIFAFLGTTAKIHSQYQTLHISVCLCHPASYSLSPTFSFSRLDFQATSLTQH